MKFGQAITTVATGTLLGLALVGAARAAEPILIGAALTLSPPGPVIWRIQIREGECFSLADIAAAHLLPRLNQLGLNSTVAGFPQVANWAERLKTRPTYAKAFPAPAPIVT